MVLAKKMLKILNYKDLETRIHKGIDTKIIFKPEDKISLRVGIQEGEPIVEIVMP